MKPIQASSKLDGRFYKSCESRLAELSKAALELNIEMNKTDANKLKCLLRAP